MRYKNDRFSQPNSSMISKYRSCSLGMGLLCRNTTSLSVKQNVSSVLRIHFVRMLEEHSLLTVYVDILKQSQELDL